MRGGDHTFLQHLTECFRSRFKKVDTVEGHPLEEPVPEAPKVEAIAKAPRGYGYQRPVRPEHLCGGGKEESVDVRLAVDDVFQDPRVRRSLGHLEVWRGHDDTLGPHPIRG